jgi:hypothetical protein
MSRPSSAHDILAYQRHVWLLLPNRAELTPIRCLDRPIADRRIQILLIISPLDALAWLPGPAPPFKLTWDLDRLIASLVHAIPHMLAFMPHDAHGLNRSCLHPAAQLHSCSLRFPSFRPSLTAGLSLIFPFFYSLWTPFFFPFQLSWQVWDYRIYRPGCYSRSAFRCCFLCGLLS